MPQNKNLEIRESLSQGIHIKNLSVNTVQTAQEVLKLMSQGDIKRNIAATQLNEQSSRSHTVFQINISSHGAQKQLTSTLNLVDLAGSEGATKTQADGLRL